MEGRSNITTIVLLAIIVILTVALAALTGFLLFGGGKTDAATGSPVQTSASAIKSEDLSTKVIFSASDQKVFNLKQEKSNQISIIKLAVVLEYFKGKDEKATLAKLDENDAEIKEAIGTYFQSLTLEQVKSADTKEKAKKDLTNIINDILNKYSTQKTEIVHNVIFEDWLFQ